MPKPCQPASCRFITSREMFLILYARKSTDRDDRQIQSIPDQVRLLQELALRLGFVIVDVITESVSARAPGKRPGFEAVLQAISEGKADGLLCWSIDRLSRNPVDSGRLQWMLQSGALQCIRTYEREYRPQDNVILFAVESGVANQYVLDLSKNVRRGLTTRRETGWITWKAPIGYRNDQTTRSVMPDDERFELLRRGWEMLLTGAYTVPEISTELTQWGLTTPRTRKRGGTPLCLSGLYRVFHDPFYKGCFTTGGILYSGAHRPMVTEGEFERAQFFLSNGKTAAQMHEFAFRGMIRCAVCGCMVTPERRVKHYKGTGRTQVYTYYHCSGAKGCPQVSIREELICERISGLLESCKVDERTHHWLEAAIERWSGTQEVSDTALWRDAKARATDFERRLGRIQEMREDGEISRADYELRRNDLIQMREQAKAEMKELEGRRSTAKASGLGVARFCATAADVFAYGSLKDKKSIALALADRYFLNLGKLEIQVSPLLLPMLKFEPPETASGSGERDGSDALIPFWSHAIEQVLDLAESEGLVFPPFRPGNPEGIARST